jgi:hypothetical protein
MLSRCRSAIPAAHTWRRLFTLARARRRAGLELERLEGRDLPSATVNVDTNVNVHAIDPNIYGTAFASTAQLADLNVPLNRDGGNASDTYSFHLPRTKRWTSVEGSHQLFRPSLRPFHMPIRWLGYVPLLTERYFKSYKPSVVLTFRSPTWSLQTSKTACLLQV